MSPGTAEATLEPEDGKPEGEVPANDPATDNLVAAIEEKQAEVNAKLADAGVTTENRAENALANMAPDDQRELDGSADEIDEPFLFLKFQLGPIKEHGVNGTTIERVLEVLIERLKGFQRGPFACKENSFALSRLKEAVKLLNTRTALREAQGVEGKNKPHES